MPIPTGGLLKVRLLQNYVGQNLENVYYYWNQANSEPASFVALGADFNLKIVDTIALLQDTGLIFQSVVMSTVLGTLPDLPISPTTATGALTGEDTTSFLAFAFRLNRTTKETRNGSKRYAGLTETNVIGNFVTPAFETLMDTFTTQLALAIDSGVALYDPVIFSPPNLTHTGNLVNIIDSATKFSTITTQRSRKRPVL